jgi:putative ABC transport system permease protein
LPAAIELDPRLLPERRDWAIALVLGALTTLNLAFGLAVDDRDGTISASVYALNALGATALAWRRLAAWIAALGIVSGVVAAAWPAWRASRLPPLEAMAM